jgi:hypothetical protein
MCHGHCIDHWSRRPNFTAWWLTPLAVMLSKFVGTEACGDRWLVIAPIHNYVGYMLVVWVVKVVEVTVSLT